MSPVVEAHAEVKLPSADLLGTVAHEMRQPLSSIESIAYYLSLIVPNEDENVQRQLARIRQLVEQSNWILSSGLRLNGPRMGAPEPLDLNQLISDAVALSAFDASAARLELWPGLPPVTMDPSQASALLDTLLVMLCPLCTTSDPLVVATSLDSDGRVLLELRIAEPGGVLASQPGSVLGLASARSIVAAHGGLLECRTTHGIRVTVMLP